MAAPRRHRFTRHDPPPLQLTHDDIGILRHVAEHRFLRSTHLVQLLQRPRDKVLRRLAALYHNGFLDRPHAQLDQLIRGGSAPLIYALGNRAFGDDGGVDWTDKNRAAKRPYIEHTLMIADVMVALEVALRHYPSIRLVRAAEIAQHSWTLSATVPGGRAPIAVTPDKVFALDFADTGRRNYYVVEADRATMPIARADPGVSSFKKKLLAYHHGHEAQRHVTQWGIPGFRVLTITTSAERMASMLDVVDAITGGKGSNVFLFAAADQLSAADPLAFAWASGKRQAVRLVP